MVHPMNNQGIFLYKLLVLYFEAEIKLGKLLQKVVFIMAS